MSNNCRTFTTDLHGSVHFTAVKHEVEVVQVAYGSLPGHVLHLLGEELGGAQRQSCVHQLSPEKSNTVRYVCLQWPTTIDRNKKKVSPCQVKGIVDNLGSVDHWNLLKK